MNWILQILTLTWICLDNSFGARGKHNNLLKYLQTSWAGISGGEWFINKKPKSSVCMRIQTSGEKVDKYT